MSLVVCMHRQGSSLTCILAPSALAGRGQNDVLPFSLMPLAARVCCGVLVVLQGCPVILKDVGDNFLFSSRH